MDKEHKNKELWSVAKRLLPSLLTITILPVAVFSLTNIISDSDHQVELKPIDVADNGSLTMNVKKNIEIEEGESFNPSDFVTAKQGNERLGIYVSGAEQLQHVGVHTVKVSSTAQDGSFIQKTITVTVKERQKELEKIEATKPEEEKKPETVKEETKVETIKDNPITEKPSTKPVTKPEVIPVEEKPTETRPPETKPADKPVEQLPVEPEKGSPDKQGNITYYPTEQKPSSQNTSGYYTSMEGCRVDHPENECMAYVGADGTTVEGYVWIGQ